MTFADLVATAVILVYTGLLSLFFFEGTELKWKIVGVALIIFAIYASYQLLASFGGGLVTYEPETLAFRERRMVVYWAGDGEADTAFVEDGVLQDYDRLVKALKRAEEALEHAATGRLTKDAAIITKALEEVRSGLNSESK